MRVIISFVFIFFVVSCASTRTSSEHEKVLQIVNNYFSQTCIIVEESDKVYISKYNNFLSFKNDQLNHVFSTDKRTVIIRYVKNFDKQYSWLKNKYQNKPFWYVNISPQITNIGLTFLTEEISLIIDSESMKVISFPYQKNIADKICDSSGFNISDWNFLPQDEKLALIKQKGQKFYENALKEHGSSLLIEAIRNNDELLSNYLIKNGSHINFNILKNAVIGGMKSTVKVILEEKIKMTQEEYIELLYFAENYFHKRIAKIIESYESSYLKDSSGGNIAFFTAIRHSDKQEILKYINDSKYGPSYEFKSYNNYTPLQLAVYSFNYETLTIFAGLLDSFKIDKLEQLGIFMFLFDDDPEKTLNIINLLKEKGLLEDDSYYIEFLNMIKFNKDGSGALTSEQKP